MKAFSGLATLGLVGLAVVTVAGFAGAYGWLLDLCAHFRPQYVVVATLLLVLLLMQKRWRAGLIASALLIANLIPIVLLYMPDTPAPRAAGPALKVMSANVYRSNREPQRILDYINRENPDVVILLEVTDNWVKALEPLNRKYPFQWVRPGDVFTGMAVYSRHRPVETRIFDLAAAHTGSFLVTLEAGRGSTPRRLSILGTHLKAPVTAEFQHERNAQLRELARIAREHPWPLLVMGDLNITQFSPFFGKMLDDGGLRACRGQQLQPTWPAGKPPLFITIDHCLAAPSLRTSEFKVGPDVGSDHFPVSVKVRLAR